MAWAAAFVRGVRAPGVGAAGIALAVGALVVVGARWFLARRRRTARPPRPRPGNMPLSSAIARAGLGEAAQLDLRAGAWGPAHGAGRPLRVVVWNIERGARLPEIVAALRSLDADVLLLQEVDYDCARSGRCDVGAEIASALSLALVYAVEARDVDERPAWRVAGCAEGNAVLTRFDVLEAFSVCLPCVRCAAMPRHDHLKKHACAGAVLATPIGPVTVYRCVRACARGGGGRGLTHTRVRCCCCCTASVPTSMLSRGESRACTNLTPSWRISRRGGRPR